MDGWVLNLLLLASYNGSVAAIPSPRPRSPGTTTGTRAVRPRSGASEAAGTGIPSVIRSYLIADPTCCGPRTDRTRSQGLSVRNSIATAHSNTERMRWCTDWAVDPFVCQIGDGIFRMSPLVTDRHLADARERGVAGSTRRHFPVKLPVALKAARAVFVYADPGHETATALRSWGDAHRRLWDALRERGRSVEVVAVFRTPGELERARTTLGRWANTAASSPATPEPGRAARCEIDRIEQAIRGMDDAVIEKHGGLQGCLKRIVELKDRLRSSRPGTAIDGFTTWRSSRLPGGGS